MDIRRIIKRLDEPASRALELLPVYNSPEYARYWQRDARLYRAFVRKLVSGGHPLRAFELAREGLGHHSDDPDLKYLLALALARGGNPYRATECLADLLKTPNVDSQLKVEILSLEAKLFKGRYERARGPASQGRAFARESAERYELAAREPGAGYFPMINAATMFLLAGDREKSGRLAEAAARLARAELRRSKKRSDYWPLATLGEAALLRGALPQAASWYREAVQQAREQGAMGDIAAMRLNLNLLCEASGLDIAAWSFFNIGTVVAFAGHRIDPPTSRGGRSLPVRFPPDPELERRVGAAIRDRLHGLNATVGYCSAASGSDLLFAEAMLERSAELHVILPFDKMDFYRTSVDYGLPVMHHWRARCDRILAQASEVHYATTEPHLDDQSLFEFVNRVIQGLAVLRAAQRGVDPHALVVLDPGSKGQLGGTGSFLEHWRSGKRNADVIDLRAMRADITASLLRRSSDSAGGRGRAAPDGKLERQIKVMLFADHKDFSKLREEQSPRFFLRFLDEVTHVLRASETPPDFCNTWGDGLFVVFEDVADCADFALRLLDRALTVDWRAMGFTETTPVRMGLHAGPVYSHYDPIIRRTNYFGSHVNRAARIEPVTMPGCAFVSEQFAALLVMEAGDEFICEYIGVEPLAKHYDRCPLYRLGRR